MENFNTTVDALMKGMDGFVSTKTVVGEPTQIGDTIIIPMADVSFGMGAGAMIEGGKTKSGGGMGGKVSPSAVLIISNGSTRLVNVKNQDAITKILDMVPDLLDRFVPAKKDDVILGEDEI